jgi:periplasmic protein CpxP/Spy
LTDSLRHIFENGVHICIDVDVRAASRTPQDIQRSRRTKQVNNKEIQMKSTRIRILTIGAAVILAVAAAIAQGMHGHGGPDGDFHHMLAFFTDKLDLTSDQQAQVKAIWEKEKPTLEPLMKQMHQNHADMRALEASGPFDEVKTRALATQHAQTMVEVEVQHARIKSEMVQVLTADQKAKLAEFEAKHQEHMQEHMKEHMGSKSD